MRPLEKFRLNARFLLPIFNLLLLMEIRDLTLSDEEFIDDLFLDQLPPDYVILSNVTHCKKDSQKDSFFQSDFYDFNNDDINAENYLMDSPHDEQYDEFDIYKDSIEKFQKELHMLHEGDNKNSFFYSILHVVRFHLTSKKTSVRKKN